MVTLKQAIAIAKNEWPGFDEYTESKSAYIFWDSTAERSMGGFGSPMVVYKKDGSVSDYPLFIIDYNEEEGELKKI